MPGLGVSFLGGLPLVGEGTSSMSGSCPLLELLGVNAGSGSSRSLKRPGVSSGEVPSKLPYCVPFGRLAVCSGVVSGVGDTSELSLLSGSLCGKSTGGDLANIVTLSFLLL